MTFGQNPLNNP